MSLNTVFRKKIILQLKNYFHKQYDNFYSMSCLWCHTYKSYNTKSDWDRNTSYPQFLPETREESIQGKFGRWVCYYIGLGNSACPILRGHLHYNKHHKISFNIFLCKIQSQVKLANLISQSTFFTNCNNVIISHQSLGRHLINIDRGKVHLDALITSPLMPCAHNC